MAKRDESCGFIIGVVDGFFRLTPPDATSLPRSSDDGDPQAAALSP
jgi:hypothetical protein